MIDLNTLVQSLDAMVITSNLSVWGLIVAIYETLLMVIVPGFFTLLFGLPLGILLYVTRKHSMMANPPAHYLLGALINAVRSVPFIILMLALFPLTRMIVGTSVGLAAAMIPLSIGAIPFFARVVEGALNEVSKGLIEALESMGATHGQVIRKALLSEALPGIVSGLTLTLVNLVGYSAIAGVIGAGGLGKLAYHIGANRFDNVVMLITVVAMIILVQGLQSLGDYVVHKKLSC